MPKPLVNPIIFWSFVGIAIILLFVAGLFMSKQCVDINGCSACWNTADKTVKSEACPGNQTCKVDAYVDRYNAVTSTLICACSKAKTGIEYPDQQLSKRITDTYKQHYGSDLSVQDICESGILLKIRY